LIYASTIGAVYGADALGEYYLMRKLVFGALGIFCTAIYQNALAESANVHQSKLFSIALRTLVLMGSVAVMSSAVIVQFGPALFELLAGKKWVGAGVMAIATAPLIVLEPITMTVAFLPVFLRLQHIAFAVAVLQGCVGIAAIGASAWLGWSVVDAIFASSLSVSLVMIGYILWLLIQARRLKDQKCGN